MSNYYCRLCLTNCKSEDSSLFSKQITEMIEYCIPEFDIKLVNNPIICGTCHNLLKQTEGFKRNCLDVQESIKKRLLSKTSTETVNICLNNLINLDTDLTTSSLPLNKTLPTTFSESYNKFLTSSVASTSNNSLEDAEVSKIMSDTSELIEETNGDHDEFLNLLESSSNIKMEIVTDMLVTSERNLHSNFYDDDPEIKPNVTSEEETSGVKTIKKSLSKQPKILKTINNPLDVLFEKLCCISCELRLNNFDSLVRHLYTIHQKASDLYACIICRYKAPNYKGIRYHYQHVHVNCIDLKGTCLFCITDKENYTQLHKHMRKEHPKNCTTDRFRCNSCDFASRKYDIFRRHFFRSHDFICNYCLKSFESIEILNRHIGSHSSYLKRKSQKLTLNT